MQNLLKILVALAVIVTGSTVHAQSGLNSYQQAALDGQEAQNKGDHATAFAQYKIACFDGNIGVTCNNLGAMAYRGTHVAKDLPLARRAYEKGCAANVASSCDVYGKMLKNGEGGYRCLARSPDQGL